jgi:hypothetical protein
LHLDFLRSCQNPDGGWGYFPGKQSWLEPTAWAALAFPAGDLVQTKAWKLVSTWQNADGSCKPSANVNIPNWTAALAVILAAKQGDKTAAQRGVEYLLGTSGSDSSTMARIAKFLSPGHTDREPKFQGWPWKPGNTSWIEPTAHSITALRLATKLLGGSAEPASLRIESAQRMILNQRCEDGGWNYGAKIALGHPLASFPETTALALVGLAGRPSQDAVSYAEKLAGQPQSPLAQAWLRIALGLHGREVPEAAPLTRQPDILIAAIEALDWKVLA